MGLTPRALRNNWESAVNQLMADVANDITECRNGEFSPKDAFNAAAGYRRDADIISTFIRDYRAHMSNDVVTQLTQSVVTLNRWIERFENWAIRVKAISI